MGSDVEWLVGVIRSGPRFFAHGDPYDFICTIIKENEKAFLMGASGNFTKETYRSIHELLKKLGLKEVRWDKKNITPRSIKKDPNAT